MTDIVPVKTPLAVQIAEWAKVMVDIEASSGEITPENEAKLNILDVSLPEKIDSTIYILSRLKNEAEYRKERAKAEHDVAMRFERKAAFIKQQVKNVLFEQGIKELAGNENRFLAVDMPGVVEIIAESEIPLKYLNERIVYDIDKEKIKADLLAGVHIPGAILKKRTDLKIYSHSPLLRKGKKE